MDADIANKPSDAFVLLCRKAWTEYVLLAFWGAVLAGLFYLSLRFFEPGYFHLLGLIPLAWFIYEWLLLRSVCLYYDESGVWVFEGILPWSKGLRGVKWRDMDEATFVTGFWAWLLRSYTIRISHRFTKESEILLTHMYNGKAVSQQINQILMEKVKQQPLN